MGRVTHIRMKTSLMKQEVKNLRKQLNKCYDDGMLVSLQESLNFFQSQSSTVGAGHQMVEEPKSSTDWGEII